MKNTLENNKYDRNKSKTHPNAKKQNTINEPQHKKTKWATFTYSGKEAKQITKLFKDTHIKIAYKTQNTIQKVTKQHTQSEKYNNSPHLPTEMPRLPTKIHWPNRQSIPRQIQRTHISNKKQ
jgi:hypothetical protein